MAESFAHGFTPGRELAADDRMSRRWLHDRHRPLLGQHLPRATVPDWDSVSVVPGYQLDRTHPTHFRAYTRTADGAIWADAGETWDEARWKLENRVRDAGW